LNANNGGGFLKKIYISFQRQYCQASKEIEILTTDSMMGSPPDSMSKTFRFGLAKVSLYAKRDPAAPEPTIM